MSKSKQLLVEDATPGTYLIWRTGLNIEGDRLEHGDVVLTQLVDTEDGLGEDFIWMLESNETYQRDPVLEIPDKGHVDYHRIIKPGTSGYNEISAFHAACTMGVVNPRLIARFIKPEALALWEKHYGQ